MGYWAKGDGSCTLKSGVDTNEINEKIKDALGMSANVTCSDDLEWEFDEASNEINFWENDTHWHEEDTYAFLNALIPYITDGVANYTSNEDDSIWRYWFDSKAKKWEEQGATIDYNFESYTDDDLIQELQKRGYNVARKE